MPAERFEDTTGWGQTEDDGNTGWSGNQVSSNNTSSTLPFHRDERTSGYASRESAQSRSTENSGNAQQDWSRGVRSDWGQQQQQQQQQHEPRFDRAQQSSSQDWSRPQPRQQEQDSGTSSRSTSFEPIPREGYIPSPRERLRMTAGAPPPTAPGRRPYEEDRSRGRPTSSGYADRSAPRQVSRDGSQPSTTAAPSRPQMSDAEFYAKCGFHYDDLPKATTTLSTSRRNSTQPSREFDSRQDQQRSSGAVANQDAAPTWNLREDEPSWGQPDGEKAGPSFSAVEAREPPKASPTDRLESTWEQPAATTTESTPQWSLEAPPQPEPPKYQSREGITSERKTEEVRKAEPSTPNTTPSSWGQSHQPEARQQSFPSWSFDKTPSGHPVRCPQCQHEFTA